MAYSNEADDLVLGAGVTIGDGTRIRGGKIVLGDGAQIGRNVDLHATEELILGKHAILGDGTVIAGRRISVGREFYTNHHAEIGGGSCFERTSSLSAGRWVHLGSYAMVNTAMPVAIGDEVGMGRFTNLYTHGAYLSLAEGFPVQFAPITLGSRVWLPSATVNPGVTIGDDVVVGVGSLVTKDIPSRCLAVGVPAKVIKEDYPPRPSDEDARTRIREHFARWDVPAEFETEGVRFRVRGALFDVRARTIEGPASKDSERTKNLLRRMGIRFAYEVSDGAWTPWRHSPPPGADTSVPPRSFRKRSALSAMTPRT